MLSSTLSHNKCVMIDNVGEYTKYAHTLTCVLQSRQETRLATAIFFHCMEITNTNI
jgi:hypothetical protein